MPWRIRISLAVQQMPARLIPVGALALGVLDQLGVHGGNHDHLRESRLVAVHDDVDLVLLQDTQVHLAEQGLGSTEEDIGDVGAEHAAAPTVAQRGPHRWVRMCSAS